MHVCKADCEWRVCDILFITGAISCRGYCHKNDITRSNLLINKETRVICQGFTGKQVNIATIYYSNVLMHEICNRVQSIANMLSSMELI